ncbi:MAG: endonuclease/exonuclease/phosphatase family protein [Bacteroidota bacterium]|nr:endonuclease/exonuclease/phosphatase family protein [Bacteroidota bacterium]MDP3146549.1 endonuclease/exonuclease/phosphatase family protein [Bacteroidota bacterium]
MKVKYVFFVAFIAFVSYSYSQKFEKDKNYFISAIGFWNVENLYDTLNDQWKNDEEFTPSGKNAWDGVRYRTKIEHLADVISQMATDVTPDGLAILGLCEIENKSVVQDLVNSPKLKKRNYQIIHIEGPDARGVDASFIYNPTYFKVTKAVSYHVTLVTDSAHKTRDILVVSGSFLGEPLTVLVNHWPSRRGGEMASRPNRNAAAKVARHISDSITTADPSAKIAIMGDFNDDPINVSIKKVINTNSDYTKCTEDQYFNPMEKPFKEGIGSLAWQDSWNLFDQIILNKTWFPKNYETWQYHAVRIFNKAYLKSDYGNYKDYPFRTYSGGTYTAGYSDHFPVYIVIAKENSIKK